MIKTTAKSNLNLPTFIFLLLTEKLISTFNQYQVFLLILLVKFWGFFIFYKANTQKNE